jgi:hypothetical protein
MAQKFSVVRLDPDTDFRPAKKPALFSMTRTEEEVSVVCEDALIPEKGKVERGWSCLKVQGPLDFSLTGILAGISVTLARAEVSIFALSTYDTDYLLVKTDQLDTAMAALLKEGYQITEAC